MRLLLSILVSFLIISSATAQLLPNLGGQRAGTSAAQFLKIGVGPRAEGMGQAYIAVANDAEALYYNPAGITQFTKNNVFFSTTRWFVDIQLEYAGLVYHLTPSDALGFAITYLHTADMEETTELYPYGTGNYFSYSDALASLSYGRNMTDKFSFGISVKYMQETLAELTMRSVLFDLGTYYKTGWRSTRFAVTITNFGKDMAPAGSFEYKNLNNEYVEVSEFQKFPPPILFRIGLAADFIKNDYNTLTASIQLNHPNDNSENLNLGVEYWWKQLFALRGGYITGRIEEDFSLGFGVRLPMKLADLGMDYSFTNFGRLGYLNRFALQLEF